MRARLTFSLRDGVIAGTVGGQRVVATIHRGVGADLGSWTKVKGLEMAWEIVEYSAGGQRGLGTRLSRNVRIQLPSDCKQGVRGGIVIVVDDGGAGLFMHGWPPCYGRRCFGVSHGWDNLVKALASEGGGSLRVV